MRKIATFLLLGAVLVVSSGATGALHLSHEHHSDFSHDCQTCHFLKTATIAIILAAIASFVIRIAPRPLAPTVQRVRAHRRTGIPVGLRAPPRF